jgi:hypothetical protein
LQPAEADSTSIGRRRFRLTEKAEQTLSFSSAPASHPSRSESIIRPAPAGPPAPDPGRGDPCAPLRLAAAALTMGKGGSATGDLRIELEEILAAIHARRPRPSWEAAVAEIAQHEFSVRGGTNEAIFADPGGRGELAPLLDDILTTADDLGLWDDDWEADGWVTNHASSMAAGSKKRAGGGNDDDSDESARASKKAALSGDVDSESSVQPAAAAAAAEDAADDDDEEEEEEEEEEDWKATVFYWRGELKLDTAERQLRWAGAWVGGSSKHTPSDDEFRSSPSTFALTAALGKGKQNSACLPACLPLSLCPASPLPLTPARAMPGCWRRRRCTPADVRTHNV